MEEFTWLRLLTAAIILLALYVVLRSARQYIPQIPFLRAYAQQIQSAIHALLLVYEPMVLVVLGSLFVLINPYHHGLLMGLLVIVGFSHMRNYMSGRLIQLGNTLAPGKQVAIGDMQGIILKMGRLGLNIQTSEGWHFMGYSELFRNGYTLISGEEIGGFFTLKISPKDAEMQQLQAAEVMDHLLTVPYLDTQHKPEILPQEAENAPLVVRVTVREESHLHDLMSLIREWGYQVEEV